MTEEVEIELGAALLDEITRKVAALRQENATLKKKVKRLELAAATSKIVNIQRISHV